MHDYYRRSREKIRGQMDGYLQLVHTEIERVFDAPYEQAFAEIWTVYERDMLERLPYVGGDKVSGTGNLTGSAFFVAIGVAGRRHGISVHEWGRLITTLYERRFAQIPRAIRRVAGWLIQRHPGLVRVALRRKDRANAQNAARNPGSFVTRTMEPAAEYPIEYRTLACPVCAFCREHGYEEFLPYLCNLDYVMFGALGVALDREHALSTGDAFCDFKTKRGAPIPSAWPPHILDESDPLK